ncbi:lectin C-type domain protein, partial [Teladorsagia circumcincta]
YVKKRATWQQAERECRRKGATLASVHSSSENEFIYRLTKNYAEAGLSPYNTLWLGRIKPKPGGGGYMWHDGSTFNYTKWAYQHPNNLESGDNCIAFYNRRLNCENEYQYFKRWIDLCCDKKLREGFVCKKFYESDLSYFAPLATLATT